MTDETNEQAPEVVESAPEVAPEVAVPAEEVAPVEPTELEKEPE